jgi:putative heme iron utilization protein
METKQQIREQLSEENKKLFNTIAEIPGGIDFLMASYAAMRGVQIADKLVRDLLPCAEIVEALHSNKAITRMPTATEVRELLQAARVFLEVVPRKPPEG